MGGEHRYYDTNADPIAAADPVAAALEEIRADHEAANYFGALADDPVPPLLAAVEAVLRLAASAKVMLRGSPPDCTNACFGGDCNCSGEARVAGWDLDPEALRNAIAAVLSGETAPLKPCPRCEGCGQLADSDDREPWSAWLNLPLASSAAVLAGIVRPVPACDQCNGSGTVPAKDGADGQ